MERSALDTDPEAYKAVHGLLDEPSADALLTGRELEVRTLTRDVVAREVAPRAATLDETRGFAGESVQALARAGLVGLIFPRRLGGTGDTHVAYAVAMEEITAGCAATSLVFMTQMHAGHPILTEGSDALAERYIPGLLDGSVYGSLGITEPNAGSDVASLQTTARKTGDGYVVNGSKTFITTGDKAGVIVCFATVDRSRGREGVTAFVIDGSWPGVSRGQPFDKLGMHGSTTAELFFDDVHVPEDHLLGEEGKGWGVMLSSVVKSRISAAAQGVGLARAAYARTLSALSRIYGRQLPDDVTFALADLRGQILQGRLLLVAMARQVDEHGAVSPDQIGIMKQVCTDLGFRASVEAARILGPFGDLKALGVERCLRDAKVTQIYDGTNEIQRLLIGRATTRAQESL